MTHLREIIVTIEVDTNKATYRAQLVLEEDENAEQFAVRVSERITELTNAALS